MEHYTRQADGGWTFRAYDQPAERLLLASMAADLLLAEIYDKVGFSAPGVAG